MKLRIEYTEYESGLCSFLSMMKSIVGLIVFWIVFNIPSFIFLLSGSSGSTAGVLFIVFSIVAVAAFVWFLFLDLDELDDKLCKEKKKNKSGSNLQKNFFDGLIEKVSPALSFGSNVYMEFVIYALFKTRIIFLFELERQGTDKNTKKLTVDIYDVFQLMKYEEVAGLKMHFPSQKTNLFENRFSAYEKIFTDTSIFSGSFVMSHISSALYWFCENGWENSALNTDFSFERLLKAERKRSGEQKYSRIHDEIDATIIEYCDEKMPSLVQKFIARS